MPSNNFERMIQLAEEVFAVKNDPGQLNVNPEVQERLHRMHPATVSEYDDGNGPVAWVLLIPTTLDLMNRFLDNTISEKELFDLTPLDTFYEAVYLCSALVLEEYRRKGIVKRLAVDAIEALRQDHPLKSLFVWPFSNEGSLCSETVARLVSLPLLKRRESISLYRR
jgi:ribosomal protein S18 acetylase RimI-like enzyme